MSLGLLVVCHHSLVEAAVVFGLGYSSEGQALSGGSRWNAAPTDFLTPDGIVERSLQDGLRYSLLGGSYEAYRDQFDWVIEPSVGEFEAAIQQSFEPWTALDPNTGLGTQLSFVEDLDTPVNFGIEQNIRLGAEIDLLAGNVGVGTYGQAYFSGEAIAAGLTLTSGTSGYEGFAITGADVTMNNHQVAWDLNTFQTILTHEIGHAIGLGDVEDFFGNGFIDDNYSPLDPLETLTNAWSHRVNPLNPARSDLFLFDVSNDINGLDAPGVDILMETDIPSRFFQTGAALQNDDFGGRQFLYPELGQLQSEEPARTVTEPSALVACLVLGLGLLTRCHRR